MTKKKMEMNENLMMNGRKVGKPAKEEEARRRGAVTQQMVVVVLYSSLKVYNLKCLEARREHEGAEMLQLVRELEFAVVVQQKRPLQVHHSRFTNAAISVGSDVSEKCRVCRAGSFHGASAFSSADMPASCCSAVHAHGLPAPAGSVHSAETAVPPGHTAPSAHVRSVGRHVGHAVRKVITQGAAPGESVGIHGNSACLIPVLEARLKLKSSVPSIAW